MSDPRIVKLAKVLTNYSLSLKKGDLLQIQGNPVAEPLIREAFREAVNCGANPFVDMIPDGLDEILFKTGSEKQIKGKPSPTDRFWGRAERCASCPSYRSLASPCLACTHTAGQPVSSRTGARSSWANGWPARACSTTRATWPRRAS